MNPEREDPILESCLEEVLGGRTPPDLTARILQAWAVQRSQIDGNTVGAGVQRSVDRARSTAQLPPATTGLNLPIPVNGNGHVKPAPVPELPIATQRRNKVAWESWAVVGSVLLVAGMLAAVIVPQIKRDHDRELAQPLQNTQPGNGPTRVKPPQQQLAAPEKTNPALKTEVENQPSVIVRSNNPPPEVVPSVPTNDPQPEANPIPQIVDTLPPAAPTIEPIPQKQLIQFVNHELSRSWAENKITPAPLATDSEWCRRVYLRLLGRIPSVEEITAFTKDRRPDRREQLVAEILETEKYADEFNRHWAGLWTNILIGRVAGTEPNDPVQREALEQYLASAFARRITYDQLLTELLTASGSTDSANIQEGAIHFLLSGFNKDATVATNRVSRIFLGVNLQCAQCHNHPTNDWDQADYWSLNAFLRQVAVERRGKDARLFDRDLVAQRGDADEAEVYYQTPSGLMKVAYPRFIDGTEISHAGELDKVKRREQLAKFIIRSPEMPRALVNRLWSHFFGYGFTKPVDDIGAGNQPSHPELLAKLAEQFVAYGFDLRAMMRCIVLSDPFQRSSRIPAGSTDVPEAGSIAHFSHYYTRQLQIEQVYDSLMIAAKFRRDTAGNNGPIQARVDWSSQFARSMATDDMGEETTFDGGTRQSLIMMSGDLMRSVTNPEQAGLLRGVIESPLSYEEKVRHLFMAALSRQPSSKELQGAQQLLAANGNNAKVALQDLWWAMLNSNEFILDH